jgi:hypothetical protein
METQLFRGNKSFYACARDAALVKSVSLTLARVQGELTLQAHASSALLPILILWRNPSSPWYSTPSRAAWGKEWFTQDLTLKEAKVSTKRCWNIKRQSSLFPSGMRSLEFQSPSQWSKVWFSSWAESFPFWPPGNGKIILTAVEKTSKCPNQKCVAA